MAQNEAGNLLKCRDCGDFKPESEFPVDKSRKRGYRYECKSCYSIQRRNGNQKETNRKWRLQKEYGLTKEQFQEMYDAQNGVCAICGKPETSTLPAYNTLRLLSIDHDHQTGKIRGLLCSKCNRAIGWFNDDPELLRKAITYLKENN